MQRRPASSALQPPFAIAIVAERRNTCVDAAGDAGDVADDGKWADLELTCKTTNFCFSAENVAADPTACSRAMCQRDLRISWYLRVKLWWERKEYGWERKEYEWERKEYKGGNAGTSS